MNRVIRQRRRTLQGCALQDAQEALSTPPGHAYQPMKGEMMRVTMGRIEQIAEPWRTQRLGGYGIWQLVIDEVAAETSSIIALGYEKAARITSGFDMDTPLHTCLRHWRKTDNKAK